MPFGYCNISNGKPYNTPNETPVKRRVLLRIHCLRSLRTTSVVLSNIQMMKSLHK